MLDIFCNLSSKFKTYRTGSNFVCLRDVCVSQPMRDVHCCFSEGKEMEVTMTLAMAPVKLKGQLGESVRIMNEP